MMESEMAACNFCIKLTPIKAINLVKREYIK